MEISGLIDVRSIAQCLGAIITDPTILDEYSFDKEDFAEPFYTLIYSVTYNLYNSGINVIDNFSIDSYLSNYKEQYRLFNDNQGLDYVTNIVELYQKENFSYFYKRLKKFSCLRYWESKGFDTRKIYDSTISEPSAQEKEMLKLDNMTVDDMIDIMDENLINEAKMKFSSNTTHIGQLAGKGLKELKESFKETPDYGLPLQSPILSTIARGCRLKKLYLRSSNSGGGKTRTGLADMAGIAIPYMYNLKTKEWEYTGFSEPVLMISTELEIPEIQTIIAAYISGVNEAHIRDGVYLPGEEERVDQAIEYIESSPFYIEFIPDFGIAEIEQLVRKYKREKSVYHFFFDYVHMSNKLIIEVATMSSGMKLREDQILFLFIDTLKNLCNKLGVFMLSSTQLNGTYKDSAEKDETMLRGAKNMADRIDLGEISLMPSPAEQKMLEKITHNIVACPEINLIRHIYKLRGNKWSKIKICQHVDLGTGRTTDVFALNRDNVLIDIPIVNLQSVDKEQVKQIESIIEENSVDIHDMPDDLDLSETEQGYIEEDAIIVERRFDW